MTRDQLNTSIDDNVTNRTEENPSSAPLIGGEMKKVADYVDERVDGISLTEGPQGVQGPAGPPGPVGPAGLNWQGQWVSGQSYSEDDAVGYSGASYFCILATSGTTAPNADLTHWALLASQGAQGPQGVQGPQGAQGPSGSEVVKTSGIVESTGTNAATATPLTYDINTVLGVNSYSVLPQDAPIGKDVYVGVNIGSAQTLRVVANTSGSTRISTINISSFSSSVLLSGTKMYRFIHLGDGYWRAEIVEFTVPNSYIGQDVVLKVERDSGGIYTVTNVLNNTGITFTASDISTTGTGLTASGNFFVDGKVFPGSTAVRNSGNPYFSYDGGFSSATLRAIYFFNEVGGTEARPTSFSIMVKYTVYP